MSIEFADHANEVLGFILVCMNLFTIYRDRNAPIEGDSKKIRRRMIWKYGLVIVVYVVVMIPLYLELSGHPEELETERTHLIWGVYGLTGILDMTLRFRRERRAYRAKVIEEVMNS